jgi:Zn-dependent protease
MKIFGKFLSDLGTILKFSPCVAVVCGIPILLHWSLALIFWLAWRATGWVGIFQWMALMLSVLLHEFGHCYYAIKYGKMVNSILLSPIGGMANVHLGMPEPRSELVITAAGPLTSLALVCLTFPLSYLFSGTETGSLLTFIATVNAYIFLFNLVPALPLDGGRILRAILQWKSGDVLWATKTAVSISQVLSAVMWLVGVYFNLFALPLIAAFVMIASAGDLEYVRAQLNPLPTFANPPIKWTTKELEEWLEKEKKIG